MYEVVDLDDVECTCANYGVLLSVHREVRAENHAQGSRASALSSVALL